MFWRQQQTITSLGAVLEPCTLDTRTFLFRLPQFLSKWAATTSETRDALREGVPGNPGPPTINRSLLLVGDIHLLLREFC